MSELEWNNRVPVSKRFQDPYFSLENGLAETEYVFLAGNDLPQRFCPGFTMAELGFGTGLTMLCAWRAWQKVCAHHALRFVSFEAFPLTAAELAEALAPFDELQALAAPFLSTWDAQLDQPVRRFALPGLVAEIVIGDARETLPKWAGAADAWCLDGFAPARNPELWEAELLKHVAMKSKPGATLATYTAAGQVRRDLAVAGFQVERVKGFGRKRHMTRAVKRD